MTETYSKAETDSKLETAEAKTDTKFAEMMGEMRLSNKDVLSKIDSLKSEIEGKIGTLQARVEMLPGRLTIIGTILGTALGVGGLLFAALQYGGATYGNGLTAHQMVQDTVAQTVKELKK